MASVLGRPLNFPNSKPVKIVGQRSAGADELVDDAMKAAKKVAKAAPQVTQPWEAHPHTETY